MMVRFVLAAAAALAAQTAQAELYFRLDAGYSKAGDAEIKDRNFAADGMICGDAACTEAATLNDVGSSPVVAAGLGWRFSPNFRADLTAAYRGGYQLDDNDSASNFKADIKSTNVMLAGYYDGAFDRFRPYVGAGIGWAQNKIGTITNTGTGFTNEIPGGTWSGLAWSLMAGLGIRLGSSLTLDLGYRYIDLGKIETPAGDASCTSPVPCTFSYSGLSGKLHAHELMLGLRF